MNEKVFKVFLARLEESAYYYGIHKNDVWKEQLEKNRKKLLETFQEQKKEIDNNNSNGHAYDYIVNDLNKKARLLKSQLSELIYTVYEHCNEGTAVMELAEKIDESMDISYSVGSNERVD